LSSFIGRDAEVEHLTGLLQSVRLLTLTGPGGVGKTRLALAVAAAVQGAYRDGVTVVSLASVDDPALVGSAIETAFGLSEHGGRSPAEIVAAHLAGKELLLVLDNFEQVVDAAPLVADLLRACPSLTALVTSRVSLKVSGDQELIVQPLMLPSPASPASTEQLLEYEAIALFAQRARESRIDFEVTADNGQTVAEICRRLDGLPLAIELAAARVKLLPPSSLLERLDRRLPLLTGGPRDAPARQQTMRAAIAWSYDLLFPDEQRLFRQLSVFAGGWTLEAAEAVCGSDLDALAGLDALVNHSLVRQREQPDESGRFEMLATIREFGQETLAAAGEADETRDRHAACYLAWAEEMSRELYWGAAPRALSGLAPEIGNIQAAFSWVVSLEQPQPRILDQALRCSFRVALFWRDNGLTSEGRRLIEAVLAKPGASDEARMGAMNGLATLAAEQGDYHRSLELHEESLVIATDFEDTLQQAWALWGVGRAFVWQGDIDRALTAYEHGLSIARRHAHREMTPQLLYFTGMALAFRGDFDRASEILDEASEVVRAAGLIRAEPLVLIFSGHVEAMRGNDRQARELTTAGLAMERKYGPTRTVMTGLVVMGELAVMGRQPERAATLLGAAWTIVEATASAVPPVYRERYEQMVREGRAQAGDDAWEAAWSAGRSAPLNEVIDLALADEPLAPEPSIAARLTPRELDVLRLVSTGLTDAEVAEQLFLSRRTVSSHLTSIYTKLGVSSRAAATRYAVDHRLV
ncbi:MAG TPA: LuxR C-terminal-related transcriptional regulator, partial [Thermomicrobiales bacterium]|nr:LuxR C-terminal-related transcriptional regulator [Thermomicrobiales bacterium]